MKTLTRIQLVLRVTLVIFIILGTKYVIDIGKDVVDPQDTLIEPIPPPTQILEEEDRTLIFIEIDPNHSIAIEPITFRDIEGKLHSDILYSLYKDSIHTGINIKAADIVTHEATTGNTIEDVQHILLFLYKKEYK